MKYRETILEAAKHYFSKDEGSGEEVVLKGELNLKTPEERQKFRDDVTIQIYLGIKKLESFLAKHG